jgi:hypothetical protein
MWKIDLGIVETATGCVMIPPTSNFYINEVSSGKTTVFTWTIRDSLALGSWPLSEQLFTATPSTEWFVPQAAHGWSVVLPGTSQANPAGACTP